MTQTIVELKKQYLRYFEDVPIQKYAAMSIKRDEDTVIRWKNDDKRFADQVEQAKAEFIRKKVLATKAEFLLERMFKDVFTPEVPVCINCSVDPIAKLKESKGVLDSFTEFMMNRTSEIILEKAKNGSKSVSVTADEIANRH